MKSPQKGRKNSCDNSPAQVHSVTRPPICNSVHSNKVTQANSLALTGAVRREEPTPTHTDLRNPTLASPRSASNTGERRSGGTFLLHPEPVNQRRRPRLSPLQTSSQPALSVYAPDSPLAALLPSRRRARRSAKTSASGMILQSKGSVFLARTFVVF